MLFALGLKDSRVPVGLTRAIRLRAVPHTEVNDQPNSIDPLDCIAME